MRIGFIGLGKLGLPCALATEQYGGHEVVGYDVRDEVKGYVHERRIPYREEQAEELLAKTSLQVLDSVEEVVAHAELLFVPIQTPHHAAFEGTQPVPQERRDFEYGYVIQGMREIAAAAAKRRKQVAVSLISTVLPGTINKHIRPLLNDYARLAYNPFFIAMGTTIPDFLSPEFVLIGSEDDAVSQTLKNFYRTLHDRPVIVTSFESAELIKVAYNTFVGMKITFANTLMEICHKTGADVDVVTGALSLATDRLLSPRYMSGGMGDGGGCHPRDHIAMSFLAKRLDLSFDLFEMLMIARDRQTEWLAHQIKDWHSLSSLPVVILGRAYKPETDLCVGSPSALLQCFLESLGVEAEVFDPYVDDSPPPLYEGPRVFFLATRHSEFATYPYPTGSVVLDPWGYVEELPGITAVRIGRK